MVAEMKNYTVIFLDSTVNRRALSLAHLRMLCAQAFTGKKILWVFET